LHRANAADQSPQQQLPLIITAEQLQMLVDASVAAANDCTPGETFARIEALLQQLTGATTVRLLHVSHWHHKLFHYRERRGSDVDSDVDASSCRTYTLLQQPVLNVGEGVAGRAALSGQAVYIEDCSLSSVTAHDSGAEVTRLHSDAPCCHVL
jgi:hypothetical protein